MVAMGEFTAKYSPSEAWRFVMKGDLLDDRIIKTGRHLSGERLEVISGLGTPMFDNRDLEALSAAAAARNRWEFQLTASPLAVPSGTGSPINLIATF